MKTVGTGDVGSWFKARSTVTAKFIARRVLGLTETACDRIHESNDYREKFTGNGRFNKHNASISRYVYPVKMGKSNQIIRNSEQI